MAHINYEEISSCVLESNQLGAGKEVNAYFYHDKVIKIFHDERKTSIPRISEEGLLKLTELQFVLINLLILYIIKV